MWVEVSVGREREGSERGTRGRERGRVGRGGERGDEGEREGTCGTRKIEIEGVWDERGVRVGRERD